MSRSSIQLLQLAGVGAVAVAVALAPCAKADPDAHSTGPGTAADSSRVRESCVGLGGNTNACQSPGSAQIYDAPPQVDYFPYAGGAT
jgi:hypothetical protein